MLVGFQRRQHRHFTLIVPIRRAVNGKIYRITMRGLVFVQEGRAYSWRSSRPLGWESRRLPRA
jgi:hypothetical protein